MTLKLCIKQTRIDSCFIQRLNVIIAYREHFHICGIFIVGISYQYVPKTTVFLRDYWLFTSYISKSNYYKDNKDHKKSVKYEIKIRLITLVCEIIPLIEKKMEYFLFHSFLLILL